MSKGEPNKKNIQRGSRGSGGEQYEEPNHPNVGHFCSSPNLEIAASSLT